MILSALKNENKILIILDMANNHMGNYVHGLGIINEFNEIIKDYKDTNLLFSFKFQYRNLSTFIHKDYKDRTDLKYVKRFLGSYLEDEEFIALKNRIEELGYLTSVTPFDNASIPKIIEQDFDIIKIGSVSFNDWPLLEDVVKINKPIILSTASQSLETIKNVYDFFKNRNKEFAFMHCRGIYPTQRKNIELNQINLLKENFDIPIGFSSHEDLFEGDNIVKLAVAKNVNILERHIDIDYKTKNAYSMTPNDIRFWLEGILEAQEICGVKNKRYEKNKKEEKDLAQFRRGVFAKEDLKSGTKLNKENIYIAWPSIENQICANDISKYTEYILREDIEKDNSILFSDVETNEKRELIYQIYRDVKAFMLRSGIALPYNFEMEISHHYGLEKFYNTGTAIITLYNNEYAKKLLVLLPNQYHPKHRHQIKKETFFVLYGHLILQLWNDDFSFNKEIDLIEGESYTVERNMIHSFEAIDKGCILEEVSTEAVSNDSFYEDENIMNNKDRKTKIIFNKGKEI